MTAEHRITRAVRAGLPLEEAWSVLREEASKGLSRTDARTMLVGLRARFNDGSPEYDRTLELLDIVEGWCQRRWEIWSSP